MEQIGFPLVFSLCVIAGGIVFLNTVWHSLDRIMLALDGELGSPPERAEASVTVPVVRHSPQPHPRRSSRPLPASVRALAKARAAAIPLRAS